MNTSLPKGLFSIPNGVDITTANGMFKDNNFELLIMNEKQWIIKRIELNNLFED